MTIITDEMRKELSEKPAAGVGEFTVIIDGCKTTVDAKGEEYSLLELTVTEGEEEGSQCNERLYIFSKDVYQYDNTALVRTKVAINKLNQIGGIFDVTISDPVKDLSKLVGKTMRVIRTESKPKEGSDKTFTNNTKFLAVAEEQDIPLA